MTVLVTGGTGFIGSCLVNKLVEAGQDVVVPVRKISSTLWLPSQGIRMVEVDLLNPEKVKAIVQDVDTVFHLASIRGSGWAFSDEDMHNTNVKMTENILKASTGVVKHFIYISSVSVHGHLNGKTADENYPYQPVKRYARTKCESEMLTKKYHGEKGLVTTIIRPVITYGPKDTWGMVPKLIGLIISKKYLTVGSGENRVHLIYIDDLIDGMMLAMNRPESYGETFILAGENPITINMLVGMIEKILRTSAPKIHVPLWFARIAAVMLETLYKTLSKDKEPVITRDKIDIMTVDRAYNITKSRNLLGFSPVVDYEKGLNMTMHWLQENKMI